ncbi:hypothetical protein [Candidatus Soleaferrea massiliensis]|uniref:hypothetical protein n=1 Tax=Candidatus Soleaferrea massiliensis TaxID=1470354 RepID=UPI00059104C1|nr:hypothetical protein [Candidatus Soleaferrea massiliensis]
MEGKERLSFREVIFQYTQYLVYFDAAMKGARGGMYMPGSRHAALFPEAEKIMMGAWRTKISEEMRGYRSVCLFDKKTI